MIRNFLTVLVLSCLLLGCSRQPDPEVRIGLVVDTTNLRGEQVVAAASIAIDEASKQGGLTIAGKAHQVRLLVENCKGLPQEALTAALRLINQESVSAIIAVVPSSSAIPMSEASEKAGVPMISPSSTHPMLTKGKRYSFRISFADDVQGRALAHFALEELGSRRAAILFDETDIHSRDMSAMFMEFFERMGGSVVVHAGFTPDVEDFAGPFRMVKAAGADLLFLPNFPGKGLKRQVSQARAMGLTIPILGSDSWEIEPLEGLPEFEGTFHGGKSEDSEARRVFDRMLVPHERDRVYVSAALTYDAVGLLLEAVREAGSTDPALVRNALARTRTYDGITGTLVYGGSGDPRRNVVVKRISKGASEVVRRIVPDELEHRTRLQEGTAELETGERQ
jgi:branched-chain amino acid transport system substrate-binding protein